MKWPWPIDCKYWNIYLSTPSLPRVNTKMYSCRHCAEIKMAVLECRNYWEQIFFLFAARLSFRNNGAQRWKFRSLRSEDVTTENSEKTDFHEARAERQDGWTAGCVDDSEAKDENKSALSRLRSSQWKDEVQLPASVGTEWCNAVNCSSGGRPDLRQKHKEEWMMERDNFLLRDQCSTVGGQGRLKK